MECGSCLGSLTEALQFNQPGQLGHAGFVAELLPSCSSVSHSFHVKELLLVACEPQFDCLCFRLYLKLLNF